MILYSPQPFLIELLAGLGIKAADHSPAIADHIQVVAYNQWRRNIGHASSGRPSDVGIGYIARTGGINGKEVF